MKILSPLFIAALVCGALGAGHAFASDVPGGETAPVQSYLYPPDQASFPKDIQEDEVQENAKSADNGQAQYISGGIGEGGMKAMEVEEKAYNLKILFAAGGAYLANVSVHIKDGKGQEVLDIVTEGPILLVKMPPGGYTLEAKASGGTMLTQQIKVGGAPLASYVLRYPAGEP